MLLGGGTVIKERPNSSCTDLFSFLRVSPLLLFVVGSGLLRREA